MDFILEPLVDEKVDEGHDRGVPAALDVEDGGLESEAIGQLREDLLLVEVGRGASLLMKG